MADGADGAIPGLEVSDTIKEVREVDGMKEVSATLDRGSLVAVQTPQAFAAGRVAAGPRRRVGGDRRCRAGRGARGYGAGRPGDPRNMKITTPADLRTAEQLMEG